MDLDRLYQRVLAIGPPYKFFTEVDPSLTVERFGLKAKLWLGNKAEFVRFTSGGYTTDNARLATALFVEPGVIPGKWAESLAVEPPQPEPEPAPPEEPKPAKHRRRY